VEGLAARQPVLMLFEDVHWSDPTSLELLDLIVDRVSALRVLLIVTLRPEFNSPWTGRPHVTSLGLNRLAPRQRAEMITGVTGGKALPNEITDQIIDRTDGVPLFVEELTKAVVETGMLTDAGDHYTATGSPTPLAIPATLQASLLARLDRLAPVREVAQIGAALGRQFSHEAASMPPTQLDNALAQLAGAELIYRRGAPPDAQYTFKHALVQDAAYSTLLRSRRLQLHAHIAAILEARFPEIVAAQPMLLAPHCGEAGLTEKAVEYWLAAGRQAWGRSAVGEAAALLRRGLALVPALPDSERSRECELDLLIALGQALSLNRVWGASELLEMNARVRQLAATLGRPRALFSALWHQINGHVLRGELRRAQLLAIELCELGDTAGDVPMRVTSRITRSYVCHALGEFTTTRAYGEEALSLYDPIDRASYAQLLPQDPGVELRNFSSWVLTLLGFFDQGSFEKEAALDEARRLSHAPSLAMAVDRAWMAAWLVGLDRASSLSYADELLALSTEHALGWWRAFALAKRGWSLAALGRADEGIAQVIAGLAGLDQLGCNYCRPWVLTLLGEACWIAGQLPAALRHLAEAQRLAEETGERWTLAETLRLRGDVLLATGEPSGAEPSYREAIAIAQQQSAKLWELRGAISLARLSRDQGKRAEARDLLASVYGWFTEGFGSPVLQEAKALLEELAS
jgi:predicted ATPase